MSDNVILSTQSLSGGYSIQYDSIKKYVDAVSNVDVILEENQIIGIAGESGCGKSTLLKMIYGYINPPLVILNGKVLLKERSGQIVDILNLSGEERKSRIWWKQISWIPQNSMNVLNPTIKIRDHFVEILKVHKGVDDKEANKIAIEHLSMVGLSKDVLNAFAHQLSGGMRQRIIIALALLTSPQIILADEPTTALDVVVQRGILQLLEGFQKEMKNTMVVVTHDLGIHAMLSNKVIIMYAGKMVEIGSSETVFTDPAHPYTRILLMSLPRLGDKLLRKGIYGSPPDLSSPPKGCRFHPRCPNALPICESKEPPIIQLGKGCLVACWLYEKG